MAIPTCFFSAVSSLTLISGDEKSPLMFFPHLMIMIYDYDFPFFFFLHDVDDDDYDYDDNDDDDDDDDGWV